ncbi:uncharacterized protein LOC110900791 [Helianthus annuus]|uniref:uncharacterized protein LOC110900791 n=1 Tax=Helianthus annuus TaxID=4232 RepID=UPI000B8F0A87|nr:uncharacterized protein LOC110900791 [Helianthus annuus]
MEQVYAEGRSGGLVSLWNPSVFQMDRVLKQRHFLVVSGIMVATGERVHIANIYAPNDPISRRGLWADLIQAIDTNSGMWLLMGDFNDVRSQDEIMNSEFVELNAWHFNSFIQITDLHEYNMGGHKFTYMSDSGVKLSKLDRFLVSKSFKDRWLLAATTALTRYTSDHCPIVLSTVPTDFGHVPFRFFNTWLDLNGFQDFVMMKCSSFSFNGPADLALATKLKFLKNNIKQWVADEKEKREGVTNALKEELKRLDETADNRPLLPVELQKRIECKNSISELDRIRLLDIKQKSRIKWAFEGDENSAYFHGVINANISNNRINGIMVDGEWLTSPTVIKDMAVGFFL